MSISRRKNQHIKLVTKSQVSREFNDRRFDYEPLLSSHIFEDVDYRFLGRKIGGPIFISSMTGGSKKAEIINRRVAGAAYNFNLPMGLGSIRPYLESKNLNSFKVRNICGENNLLFGNLGIAQIEQLLERKEVFKLERAIGELDLDGLIIHINPLQEWNQPNGDLYLKPPVETLERIIPKLKTKIIVKEVGAGFGKDSLLCLLQLPIDAIDISSFGGTNFTKLELLRGNRESRDYKSPLINIGHTADEMIYYLNNFIKNNIGLDKEFIVSGGIRNFLDGYYYNSLLNAASVYGYAHKILSYAVKSEKLLYNFLDSEIRNYSFARNFLRIKSKT